MIILKRQLLKKVSLELQNNNAYQIFRSFNLFLRICYRSFKFPGKTFSCQKQKMTQHQIDSFGVLEEFHYINVVQTTYILFKQRST